MRPSSTAALLAVFVGLFGVLGYGAITSELTDAGVLTGAPALILVQLLCIGVPPLLYYSAKPRHRPALRMNPIDAGTVALLSLSALVGTFALDNLAAYWHALLRSFGLVLRQDGAAPARTGEQLALLLLAVAFAPALFEELLFRGFLLPSMEPFGSRWAVCVSGVLFALLHGRIEMLPTHILLGVLLSYLVLRTDSVWSAVLYHMIHNTAILAAAFFANVFPKLVPEWARNDVALLLPVTAALLIAWGGLLYASLWYDDRRRKPTLPYAEPERMPVLSAILLASCIIVLLVAQFTALRGMLPRTLL